MRNGAFRILRLLGIDIKLHITFFLVVIWAAYQWGFGPNGDGLLGASFGITVIVGLFVIVTLHELGHALAARLFGVRTVDIILWPLGGVARLEHMPRRPVQELVIALAGPAVNLVLLIPLIPAAFFIITRADQPIFLLLREPSFTSLLLYLTIINASLAIFNLLPAFPMDGGRILRALLALVIPHHRATAIAAWIGQALAVGLAIWSFTRGDILTGLVGVFIFLAARQENAFIQSQAAFEHLTVAQAYSRSLHFLTPSDLLRRPLELTLTSPQADFAVLDNESLVGLVTQGDLLASVRNLGETATVAQAMRTDFLSVTPGDSLFDVQTQLATRRQPAAPVISPQGYLGLITLRDIEEMFRLHRANPAVAQTLFRQ